MAASSTVRARIDEDIKREATAVLEDFGLTVSDVIKITLTRVAKEHGLPFALEQPKAETLKAMKEARALMKARRAKFAGAEAMFDGLEDQTSRE